MPPGGRFALHDRLLAALERLEAKPTQAAAWEELRRLAHELEPANLPGLLNMAGSTTASSTQFSRVHCLRLAALCAIPGACPPAARAALLQPPLLGKLLGLLGRALRDADAAVRGAAAEGLGIAAAQLAALHGPEPMPADAEHPVLACILDALAEPGAGVQAGAAAALAQAAEHLGPLDPALLRQLARTAANPLFLGRAELWGAVARLEGGRVRGLVAGSLRGLLDMWPDLLGSPGEGTGLLGTLAERGQKGFQARAAAAHTLKALAVGVGPMASGWEAAAATLKAAKTDVSKPVREAAAGAMPVLSELLAFVASGAPVAQWPAVCGALLAAEAGGGKRAGSKPAGGFAAAPGEPAAPGQLIPAVYAPAAMLPLPAPAPAASGAFYGMPPVAMAPAGAVLPQQSSALPAPPPGAFIAPQAFPPAPAACAAPPAPASSSSSSSREQQLAAQLAAVLERQARMEAAFGAFAASTQNSLQHLQQCLGGLSADVAACWAAAPVSPQMAQVQQRLASSMAALAVGAQQAQQAQQFLTCSDVDAAPTSTASPAGCPKRLSSLHRSYDTLQRDLGRQPVPVQQPLASPPAAATPSAPAAVPALAASPMAKPGPVTPEPPAAPASPAVIAPAAQPAAAAAPSPAAAPAPLPDWQAAYSQVLGSVTNAAFAADQQAQLKLLRCLARSGPVWEQLGGATGQGLMQAITALLQSGTALKRLLPCLWPLADTATAASRAAASYPAATRQALLAALEAYPLPPAAEPQQEGGAAGSGASPASSELGERRDLLLSALRAVWA